MSSICNPCKECSVFARLFSTLQCKFDILACVCCSLALVRHCVSYRSAIPFARGVWDGTVASTYLHHQLWTKKSLHRVQQEQGESSFYYPHQRRKYCIWVRLSACLSVCLFLCLFVCPHRTLVFFCATTCLIETKFSPSERLLRWNVSMIIMMSSLTWCGSHFGFTLKPKKIFSRTAGQIKGKLHKCSPSIGCTSLFRNN